MPTRLNTTGQLQKKYKRAQAVRHYAGVGLGSVAAVLSVSGIATSLTGPGVIIAVPLVGVAAFCGTASAFLTGASKKLSSKVAKHKKIHSLAFWKQYLINNLVSKALNDNTITDREFQLVNSEFEEYFKLKESLKAKLNHKPSPKEQPQNLEKLKKIKNEVREELQKKILNAE